MSEAVIRTVQSLVQQPTLDIDALASALDAMSAADRVTAVRAMNGKMQARIWDAAAGRKATVADVVPPSVSAVTEVIHAGKNSLPLFSSFEKRFMRSATDPNVLYGYNEGSTRWLIGPGYFVATDDPARGEVAVNYYDVPPSDAQLVTSWPAVKPNEKGLQRFVFAKMIDYLRNVSTHVTIGRAYKKGKETNNYFLLCRTV